MRPQSFSTIVCTLVFVSLQSCADSNDDVQLPESSATWMANGHLPQACTPDTGLLDLLRDSSLRCSCVVSDTRGNGLARPSPERDQG